jgi:hypothetical protein
MMAVLEMKGSNEIKWLHAIRSIGRSDGLSAVFGIGSVEWELHVR